MKFSCLTWNTAKRLKYVYDQVKLIQQTNPDIVALQEVIISSDKKFKRLLASHYPISHPVLTLHQIRVS